MARFKPMNQQPASMPKDRAGVIAPPPFSLVKNVVMSGALQGPFDLSFHLFWSVGATIAAITRSDLFHKAFICARVSFFVYIGALFAELR